MRGAYLGPHFDNDEIGAFLDENQYPYRKLSGEEWAQTIAAILAEQNVVRVVLGADGVRSARARTSVDRWRRAFFQNAVDHEPEDQVPRVLSSVRSLGVV